MFDEEEDCDSIEEEDEREEASIDGEEAVPDIAYNSNVASWLLCAC
jgi:hypothetical protein